MADYYYYLAYRTEDNKIIPFSIKNLRGAYQEIYHHCSTDDAFYNYFKEFRDRDEIDPEFLAQLIPSEEDDWDAYHNTGIAWKSLDSLTARFPIKKGYFRVEDVIQYEKDHWFSEEMFDSMISPTVYAGLLANEMVLGRNEDEYNGFNASDYVYYAIEDIYSKEYVEYHIKCIAENLIDWDDRFEKEVIIVGKKL